MCFEAAFSLELEPERSRQQKKKLNVSSQSLNFFFMLSTLKKSWKFNQLNEDVVIRRSGVLFYPRLQGFLLCFQTRSDQTAIYDQGCYFSIKVFCVHFVYCIIFNFPTEFYIILNFLVHLLSIKSYRVEIDFIFLLPKNLSVCVFSRQQSSFDRLRPPNASLSPPILC